MGTQFSKSLICLFDLMMNSAGSRNENNQNDKPNKAGIAMDGDEKFVMKQSVPIDLIKVFVIFGKWSFIFPNQASKTYIDYLNDTIVFRWVGLFFWTHCPVKNQN
jgi:hypothetical protein